MLSVFTGYCFLGTEIDDKIAGTLALGKTVEVKGWNSDFPLSIFILVTISTGDLFENSVTAAISDDFPDV